MMWWSPSLYHNTPEMERKKGAACVLWQHRMDEPIGVYTEMKEYESGFMSGDDYSLMMIPWQNVHMPI